MPFGDKEEKKNITIFFSLLHVKERTGSRDKGEL
jgi:hypothetical protein